jgi:hypothetical protein
VNERIRAPLNLLRGVGEKAHAELEQYRPLKDIKDLCEKIQAHKISGTKEIVKKDKEGNPKTSKQKGKSALHSGIIKTLIVSGATDGLFPPGLDMLEQLNQYVATNCIVTGNVFKRKTDERYGMPKETVDEKYLNLTPLQRYQMKKQVLPAFSTNLFPMVMQQGVPNLRVAGREYRYFTDGGDGDSIPVALDQHLKYYSDLQPWPRGHTVEVATVGYVVSHEVRRYQGVKEMSKFLIDIEGTRWDLVKWPDRKTGLLADFYKQDFTGAIVLLHVSKWNGDRPFAIENLEIIQSPLDAAAAAESSPEKES